LEADNKTCSPRHEARTFFERNARGVSQNPKPLGRGGKEGGRSGSEEPSGSKSWGKGIPAPPSLSVAAEFRTSETGASPKSIL